MASQPGIELSQAQRGLLAERLAGYGRKRAVAGRLGCHPAHLGHVLAGVKRPSEPLLRGLCSELGLPLSISTRIRIGGV